LCLASVPAFSQVFEVADVKANKSGEARMAVDFQAGGKFSARNVPLKILIMLAYHVRAEAVTGAPAWLDSERFDVVAKTAPASSQDEIRRMLQNLLAERFKLAVSRDQKILPAYALLVGKSGARLQESPGAPLAEHRCLPTDAAPAQKHVACRHLSMAEFADSLQELSPRDFDVPIVDQTGLTGAYDFKLAWTPAASVANASVDGSPGPSVFEAVQEQLGLKLERKKMPLPVLVIDSVQRVPSDN